GVRKPPRHEHPDDRRGDEPVARRMIEDMTIRKFAPKTQHDYVQRIKNFTAFPGRAPTPQAPRMCADISCICCIVAPFSAAIMAPAFRRGDQCLGRAHMLCDVVPKTPQIDDEAAPHSSEGVLNYDQLEPRRF